MYYNSKDGKYYFDNSHTYNKSKQSYCTLTTGVLKREPDTVSAVINIVNLSKYNSENVIVEVWDWSNFTKCKKVLVLIGDNCPVKFPYKLKPNNLAAMYAPLGCTVNLFEIRIIYPKGTNIIANCFGRSLRPSASQEGNTVLHSQLVEINLNSRR